MGHRGKNQTMAKFGAALVEVLLVLEVTTFSFAAGSSVNSRRALLASTEQLRTIAVDLMDFQHVDSPYMQPNLTLKERAQISVERSNQRLKYFSSQILERRNKIGNQSNPRRETADYAFTTPVTYTPSNYIMKISVGTPTRKFVAYADTGSDLVWLQCSTCTNCLQTPDPAYDPTASSTYTSMPCTDPLCPDLGTDEVTPCPSTNICGFNYPYGDRSFTQGDMGYETFTFTKNSAVPFTQVGFGCGEDNEMSTVMYGDGLVGLGNGPLSLVKQLGSYIGPVFTYCLVDHQAAVTKTSALLLGSAGALAKDYTPLLTNPFNPTNYFVNLMGITVNGQQVIYPSDTFTIGSDGSGGIFLDSGTTITYLFEAAYTPFLSAVSTFISYPVMTVPNFDPCYDTSSVSTPVFPVVVFQFQNVFLTLSADNTFMQVDPGTYCLAFSHVSSDAVSIFGHIQQQNFEIAYDIVNGQVGFAAATC